MAGRGSLGGTRRAWRGVKHRAFVLMTVAEKAAAMVPAQSQSEGDAPPLVEIGAEGREEKGPEVMVE